MATDDAWPDGSELSKGYALGAEARKPTALLDWSLHVDCPQCFLGNNLANCLHDTENSIAGHIFTHAWDKLEGWEVKCEGCGHEFEIDRVEYDGAYRIGKAASRRRVGP